MIARKRTSVLSTAMYMPQQNSSTAVNFYESTKRCIDVILSLVLIIFCLPVIIGISVAIRSEGSGVFFRQIRVGRSAKPFEIFKFRTMVKNSEALLVHHLATCPEAAAAWAGRRKLSHDPRVTRLGHVLRKTSLDELPQLFNVLRGDMSLVGPRPVLLEELNDFYGAEGRSAYLSVRPGMTGLWQVSGRSDTSYADRVALDIRYARGRTLTGDMRLLALTVPAILSQRGAG